MYLRSLVACFVQFSSAGGRTNLRLRQLQAFHEAYSWYRLGRHAVARVQVEFLSAYIRKGEETGLAQL